jgi:hypothetical protein
MADWSPAPATQAVLDQVNDVLHEFSAYLPMTARQVFYRLVGAHDFDKTERAYKRLLEYLNRARRAGMVSWSAIRDDGFDTIGGGGWDSPQEVIDSAISTADHYERDHQDGQPTFVELWVEAAGMMPQAERMVSSYSVPVYSSGGFNSTTAKYQTARRIVRRWHNEGRKTAVLHIGDYDPSGVAIIDSLADDIGAFIEDLTGRWSADAVEFERVAVTPEQIGDYGLPGAPPKATDRRSGFVDLAVQAEALSPPDLEAEVLAVMNRRWDVDAYDALLETEADERARLVTALQGLTL